MSPTGKAVVDVPDRAASAAHAPETIAPPGSFYIPSLDGIRAISFLLVFFSHTGLGYIIPGGFGVTIFFLLSGFLITTLLRMEFAKYGDIRLGSFYLRRVFRILPPLYVVLLFGMVLAHFNKIEPGIPFMGTLMQALQVSNYYQLYSAGLLIPGSEVLWSLAIEEHFYLIFPLLYLWLCRRFSATVQAWILLGLCTADLAWRCVLHNVLHASDARTFFATDARFDSIVFGCIFAIIANPTLRDPLSAWIIRRTKWLLPLACALLLATFLVRSDTFRETFRYTLQGIALVPIFIAAIHFQDWTVVRFLNLPAVRFLGVLSYVLYLCHFMILRSLTDAFSLNPFVHGAISLAAALVFSTVVHYGVERPFVRVRKVLSKSLA